MNCVSLFKLTYYFIKTFEVNFIYYNFYLVKIMGINKDILYIIYISHKFVFIVL